LEHLRSRVLDKNEGKIFERMIKFQSKGGGGLGSGDVGLVFGC